MPAALPVSGWLDLFDPAGPVDPMASRWLQAVLRFGRADGSPVFGPRGRSSARLRLLRGWAGRLGDPSLQAVLARWLPSPTPASPPPDPSDSRPDRVLAVLRPDWGPRGDLLAVDHRRAGDGTLVEVSGRGRTWIGPGWDSGDDFGRCGPASPTLRASNVYADCVEWSYRAGPRRVTRCVVLVRGRSMALLGQEVDGPGSSIGVRFDLGEGVEASPIEGSRAVLLSAGNNKPTARVIPLGLPPNDRATDLGSIAIEGRRLAIRQEGAGRRRWLGALVCWGRPPTGWRPLTVAERSKACRGEVAVACKVDWGPREDALVIYRSLARPALRSFLGHQTGSRFLVGLFHRSGEVRPLLKVGP